MTDVVNPKSSSPDQLLPYHKKISAEDKALMVYFISYTYMVLNEQATWFMGKRIDNPNTHGTGCTLSSAIASNLAKGYDLKTSVKYAKNYISGALAAGLNLGKGSGPMNHAFAIEGEYTNE